MAARSAPGRPGTSRRCSARILAGSAAVHDATEARGASNAKARRELGWELRYPSWRQGFPAVYGTPARDVPPVGIGAPASDPLSRSEARARVGSDPARRACCRALPNLL